MSDDILKSAIENVIKKYVDNCVLTQVDKIEGRYIIELKYKDVEVKYILHKRYENSEFYIHRVLLDMCNELSKLSKLSKEKIFLKGEKENE